MRRIRRALTELRMWFLGREQTRGNVAESMIDLRSPDIAIDPFPHYETLRSRGSVHFLPGEQAWIVLGYGQVQYAFSHPELLSNRAYDDVDAVLLGAGPPEHTKARRAVSRFFSRDLVDQLVTYAHDHAAGLLGGEIDVVEDYAVPLTEEVACRLVGVDSETVKLIRTARSEAADLASFFSAFTEISPRASTYGELRSMGFSEDEAVSLVRLLWLASTTTTERMISRCVLRLIEHPELRRSIGEDMSLIPPFVEEILRLYPPELMVPRVATEPVMLGDVTIPAGSLVYLCVAAANRDPDVFEDPSELKLQRTAVRHFTFGYGIHACIGSTLGRRIIETAVRVLLTQCPSFRPAQSLDQIELFSTPTANALIHLRIETGLTPLREFPGRPVEGDPPVRCKKPST